MRAKIGDYGLSQATFPSDYFLLQAQGFSLPVRWLSPEIVQNYNDSGSSSWRPVYSKASDIWLLPPTPFADLSSISSLPLSCRAFGVCLWEIATMAERPFPRLANSEAMTKLAANEHPAMDRVPVALKDVLSQCWNGDPLSRPSATHVENLLRGIQDRLNDVSMAENGQKPGPPPLTTVKSNGTRRSVWAMVSRR